MCCEADAGVTVFPPAGMTLSSPERSRLDELEGDTFVSEGADKTHHEWGQSESGVAQLVERFSLPGELVVDPFLGVGTTAVVCQGLGRRFIGCDIDAQAVQTTLARLVDAEESAG
jgi:hypothetical protein